MESDEELMARYVAGDQAAFRALFDRHAPRLTSMLRRRLGRDEDVADLVQQTFLQMHRARRDFHQGSRLRPWLYTIALNLLRKHYRTLGRRPTSALEEDPRDPTGSAGLPIKEVQRAEDRQRLRAALAELPENQRVVVELHWFEGLPFADVAEVVGASLSAVKVRAHRAYKRLNDILSEDRNRGGGAG